MFTPQEESRSNHGKNRPDPAQDTAENQQEQRDQQEQQTPRTPQAKKALFVVTAADTWTLKDGEKHPTGFWGEELAVPHKIFTEAGWHVTIATPGGVAPTVDQLSLGLAGGSPRKRKMVREYLVAIDAQLKTPTPLEQINHEDFDLVFYPGGHGPMEDLAYDETSGALLASRVASDQPLALLCHGPAAILAAGAKGENPFAGRKMTALSNKEEKLNIFGWKAQWYLEDALTEAGVEFSAGFPLRPNVVVDGNLYTGQNPQSSEKLAQRLIEDLS